MALAYVLLLAIIAFGLPLALNLRARVNAEVRTQARGQADLIAATAADLLGAGARRELVTLSRTGAMSVRGRVLVVNRRGIVLVDSAGAALGSSYLSRPEITSALRGRPVQIQRASRTLGEQILATAVPVIRNAHTVGAVRVTQSVAAVQSAVGRAELGLVLIALIVLALGLVAGVIIARQVSGPIGKLEAVARRLDQGDLLSARAAVEGSREQRSLAGSFNEMAARIQNLVQAQRAFVADASHQLRTPLTGLRLRLEEARHELTEETPAKDLDAALEEVDRLSTTVDELLVLSRAGERRLEGAILDLSQLCRETVTRWSPVADSHGIRLEHAEQSRGVVWAARRDVERALDALVENALRYAPSGSTVTVISLPAGIEVDDQGPGFAGGEQDEVFERFRRGSAAESDRSGSGLGLPIARELARAWGGDVTIANGPSGGAAVTISLPAAPDGPQAEVTRANPSSNPVGAS